MSGGISRNVAVFRGIPMVLNMTGVRRWIWHTRWTLRAWIGSWCPTTSCSVRTSDAYADPSVGGQPAAGNRPGLTEAGWSPLWF